MNLIEETTPERLGFELEQFVEYESLPYYFNGQLDWDVEKGMKNWVCSQMI